MGDITGWSVDRLAANNLLAALGVDATEERLDIAARHFSLHRETAMSLAAERARTQAIRALEQGSADRLADEPPQWGDGYRYAEEIIARLAPDDWMDMGPARARTKGQILRTLMRSARSQTLWRKSRDD